MNVQAVVSSLENVGHACIRGCIDSPSLESTRAQLLAEYLQCLPLPWRGGGKWFGHVNYIPSPVNDSILACLNCESIYTAVASALGSDFRVVAAVGNANLPGSRFQPAHVDGRMGRDYLIVNLPLGLVDETNGATEVWEGSHRVDNSLLGEKRVRQRFQIHKLITSSGDVVLRYPNLWHRGTPNFSETVRFMLGVTITTQYHLHAPLKVNKYEYEILREARLPFHVEIGLTAPRGFQPNYFSTSLAGQLREAAWVWANPLFRVARALSLKTRT